MFFPIEISLNNFGFYHKSLKWLIRLFSRQTHRLPQSSPHLSLSH